MNMQMSALMMSSPHNFPFILYTEITKISHFSYESVRLALIKLNLFRISPLSVVVKTRGGGGGGGAVPQSQPSSNTGVSSCIQIHGYFLCYMTSD